MRLRGHERGEVLSGVNTSLIAVRALVIVLKSYGVKSLQDGVYGVFKLCLLALPLHFA